MLVLLLDSLDRGLEIRMDLEKGGTADRVGDRVVAESLGSDRYQVRTHSCFSDHPSLVLSSAPLPSAFYIPICPLPPMTEEELEITYIPSEHQRYSTLRRKYAHLEGRKSHAWLIGAALWLISGVFYKAIPLAHLSLGSTDVTLRYLHWIYDIHRLCVSYPVVAQARF